MSSPLRTIQDWSATPADAVRWACILEATSPKPGNVFPGRRFADLQFGDFASAAEIAAKHLGNQAALVSDRMLAAVDETASKLGTNVHLGIILLLGPLVAADEKLNCHDHPLQPIDQPLRPIDQWQPAIAAVLAGFTEVDGGKIFMAIQRASAGSLGSVDSMDVNNHHAVIDLAAAMKLAQGRDRVALQYATDFRDLMTRVVPAIRDAIARSGDLLSGICHAHVRLLADAPDSLIARKNGSEVAANVQQRAQEVDLNNSHSIENFDRFLREDGNRLNPGTTADLIAAGLYVLLRTP